MYRGIDDYQHSWVVDLIIKYVCGIRPEGERVTIDPFPFGLRHLTIDDVIVKGRRLKIEINEKRFCVSMDGTLVGESRVGKPIALTSF